MSEPVAGVVLRQSHAGSGRPWQDWVLRLWERGGPNMDKGTLCDLHFTPRQGPQERVLFLWPRMAPGRQGEKMAHTICLGPTAQSEAGNSGGADRPPFTINVTKRVLRRGAVHCMCCFLGVWADSGGCCRDPIALETTGSLWNRGQMAMSEARGIQ